MGYYRVAQICLNGHCIASSVDAHPQLSSKFCDRCGKSTITQCPSCNTKIRGDYDNPEAVVFFSYDIPSYCHECGEPYPWTKTALQAAEEIIREEESLAPAEQTSVVEILPDIVVDTPRTSLAVMRMKKFVGKAAPVVGQAIKDLLISFATETAKKGLGW